MSCKYKVVARYSFDDGYEEPFDTEEEALDYLRKTFTTEVSEDIAMGNNFQATMQNDGRCGVILNFRRSGDTDFSCWFVEPRHMGGA